MKHENKGPKSREVATMRVSGTSREIQRGVWCIREVREAASVCRVQVEVGQCPMLDCAFGPSEAFICGGPSTTIGLQLRLFVTLQLKSDRLKGPTRLGKNRTSRPFAVRQSQSSRSFIRICILYGTISHTDKLALALASISACETETRSWRELGNNSPTETLRAAQ
jgi:hypothetical protein